MVLTMILNKSKISMDAIQGMNPGAPVKESAAFRGDYYEAS